MTRFIKSRRRLGGPKEDYQLVTQELSVPFRKNILTQALEQLELMENTKWGNLNYLHYFR